MTPNRRRFLHFFDPVCTENSYPVLPRAAPTTPARLTPPSSSLASRSPERRVSLPNPYSAHCLGHGRGRLICYAVAAHPTADWPARQITDAFPSDTTPKYLIRDNDRAHCRVMELEASKTHTDPCSQRPGKSQAAAR